MKEKLLINNTNINKEIDTNNNNIPFAFNFRLYLNKNNFPNKTSITNAIITIKNIFILISYFLTVFIS